MPSVIGLVEESAEVVHRWLLLLSFLWMAGGGGHGGIQRGGGSCGRA